MASPLKDSKTAPSRLSTTDSDDPPAAVATRPGLGERRTSVVITRRGTLRDLAVGREPSSDGSEVSETATPAARPTWLRPSASTKDLTILRFKKGEREGPPLEVAAVVDICMNPKKREAAGLKSLGKGAYAHVVCFASAARVRLDDGTDVVASRLAIKVGAWMTEASFDRECDCQAAAAAWGVAPKVRHAVWGGAGKLSAFAMDRCTGPSFHGWLMWVSKDLLRRPGARGRPGAWVVDPQTRKLPLVRAWTLEADKVRRQLAAAAIRHGDVHDANIMFDVPGEAEAIYADGGGDPKVLKRRLMRAIARGPANGARLVIVDFGQAQKLGAVGKLCLSICGDDKRFVDPSDCDAASDATELDARPEDIDTDAYIGASAP